MGAQIIKILGLSLLMVVMTGCSSMSASFDSFKYGKLYAMQDALNQALMNSCTDKEVVARAINWVAIGYSDLDESRKFTSFESEEHGHIKNLMSSLSLVTSRRNHDSDALCGRMTQVAKVTREYLAKVTSDKQVIVASSGY
jgi:hypothetical protein